jgi:hypothetical protein
LHGLSVHNKNKSAYLKNSIPITKGLNHVNLLYYLLRKANLTNNELSHPETKIFRYSSLSFSEDNLINTRIGLLDLYRNSQLIMQSETNKNTLQQFIKNTSAYISTHRAVDEYEKEEDLVRELAYLSSVFRVHQSNNDISIKKNASLSLRLIISKYYKNNIFGTGSIHFHSKASVASSAFAFLCILRENAPNNNDIKIKLLKFLSKHVIKPIPENLNDMQSYLQAVFCISEYNRNSSDHIISIPIIDINKLNQYEINDILLIGLWLNKTLLTLYHQTMNTEYKELLYKICHQIIKYQIPENYYEVDLIGGYSYLGQYRVTSVLTESIMVGLACASKENNQEQIHVFNCSVLKSFRVLIQAQNKSQPFTSNEGGIPNSIIDSSVRPDNVQHALDAVQDYLDTM